MIADSMPRKTLQAAPLQAHKPSAKPVQGTFLVQIFSIAHHSDTPFDWASIAALERVVRIT
jgi:hypothetical protein